MSGPGIGHRVDLVLRAFPGNGATKLVLLGIAYHDGEGGSWPSLDTLATYASVERRHARRVLRDLERDGWIETHPNEGGLRNVRADRRSNLYVVDYDRLEGLLSHGGTSRPPRTGGHPGSDGGACGAPRGGIQGPDEGAPMPPEQDLEQDPEQDRERGHPDGLPAVTRESPVLDDALMLTRLLAEQLVARGYPVVAGGMSKRWVVDMEQMLRLDGRSADEVGKVLRWLDRGQDDIAAFWRTNVRSPATLRAKWTVMAEQYARSRRALKPRTGAESTIERLADRFAPSRAAAAQSSLALGTGSGQGPRDPTPRRP